MARATNPLISVELSVGLTGTLYQSLDSGLLDLVFDGDVVEITVWDTDSRLPVPCAAEPGRIGPGPTRLAPVAR